MKTKYECECCGNLWDTEKACMTHEEAVKRIRAGVKRYDVVVFQLDCSLDFRDGSVYTTVETDDQVVYQNKPGEALHHRFNLTDTSFGAYLNPGKPHIDYSIGDRIVVSCVKITGQDDREYDDIVAELVGVAKEHYKEIREGITKFIGDER